MWRAYPQNVDKAAGGECLDALILVAQQVVGDELLGHFGDRVLIGGLLLQIHELLGEGIESAVQFAGGNGLSRAPGQGLIELQLDEASVLLLRPLIFDRVRTATRRHVV